MTRKAKVIFHVDMNSFYASVEIAQNPSLKGKAVAIAGNPKERRGIIVTSSYEARAKGVKTTMPLWEARKLCPELIVIRPNFDLYREVSAKIFKILAEINPLIEPVSIDEGYLDVTNNPIHPLQLAKDIQNELLEKLHIPCSIGIGPNKFLAKTASDMKKPLGITVLRIRDLPQKLWPLPIEEMYGVGIKTAEKLRSFKINLIEDLAKADPYELTHLLGINGQRLIQRANGIDRRPVNPDSVNEFKSIGNSTTFHKDITDETELKAHILHLAKRVEQRLQRRKFKGKTVQLMIRYYDRQTITRSKKLDNFINTKEEIYTNIIQLLQLHWTKEPVRLLGVTVQDLLEEQYIVEQLSLFTYQEEEKKARMEETIKNLEAKFGTETFLQYTKEDRVTDQVDDSLLKTSFQKDFLDDYKKD